MSFRAIWIAAAIATAALLVAPTALATAPSSRSRVLTRRQATAALESLPYRFDLRRVEHLPRGAAAAIAGEASGPAGTKVQFAVALGRRAAAVPLPDTGVSDTTFVPSAGFTFTDDLLERTAPGKFRPNRAFRDERQYRVAAKMFTRIESALCVAATGRDCGI